MTNEMLSGAKCLIQELINQGVELVFGYPGGAILPVYAELGKSPIKHILTRTEQGAAHAANGYAKISGKVGVCIATSGPGATNLVTGLANAFLDSVPIVAITGQVATTMVGTDAFQEVDITGITHPITKHNYLVTDPDDIPRIIAEAFYIASTGRPGPVLVDIPKNISEAMCRYKGSVAVNLPGYKPTYKGHPTQIKNACSALTAAERPLIYAGGGIVSSRAWDKLLALAEAIQAPVVSTLMGLGSFPVGHELYLGMLGLHGMPAANLAVSNCDVLLSVGARFGDRVTGPAAKFAADATIIHIDIDPAEIGKNKKTDIPIVGDAGNVLADMLERVEKKRCDKWLAQVAEYKKLNEELFACGMDRLSGKYIISALSALRQGRDILVTDVGQHQMTAAQYYKINRLGGFISSGGLGTMGYGLPAALGAQIASPNETVICVLGDGGFQMSMNELATIRGNNLPVKIILFNNGVLGMVRQLQHFYCNREYFAIDMQGNPDFVKVAEAYNIPAYRIDSMEQVDRVLTEALSIDGPAFIECVIPADELVYPMVPAGKGISEMVLPEK